MVIVILQRDTLYFDPEFFSDFNVSHAKFEITVPNRFLGTRIIPVCAKIISERRTDLNEALRRYLTFGLPRGWWYAPLKVFSMSHFLHME